MSCRQASRELLERFRFGEELDRRSDPHLAHLQGCEACRTEVGLDQALILQLRRALRLRVAGHAASPDVWRGVLARVAAPAGPTWAERMMRWARAVPAGAAMALMLFAVVSGAGGQRRAAVQPLLWPSLVVEGVDAPDPELPWYIRDRPPPPISPPASGSIAWVDPADADNAPLVPAPVQHVTP